MRNGMKQPVIKEALGQEWDLLSQILRQHYDITPGTASQMVMNGTIEKIDHSVIAKLFLPSSRVFGALIPYKGENIKSEVRNWTDRQNGVSMFWDRTFYFPNKRPIIFSSRMERYGDHEIIEYVRYGMGLLMKISVEDSALVFRSIGYRWKIGRFEIPIPNWALLGNAEIIEKPISDKTFHVDFKIIHPLYGRTYTYSGTYTIATSDEKTDSP